MTENIFIRCTFPANFSIVIFCFSIVNMLNKPFHASEAVCLFFSRSDVSVSRHVKFLSIYEMIAEMFLRSEEDGIFTGDGIV